ncbi:MAG: hypothetical protein ABH875_02755 [Candidatus Omnitrophota bacterium]
MKRKILGPILFSILILAPAAISYADGQSWTAGGDGSKWSDADNWTAEEVPGLSSDVIIDREDAGVACDDDFQAKSMTIGGHKASSLTVENYVSGDIAPYSSTDIAIKNRRGGHIVLSGPGVIKISGRYEDSEGALDPEPCLLFWIE